NSNMSVTIRWGRVSLLHRMNIRGSGGHGLRVDATSGKGTDKSVCATPARPDRRSLLAAVDPPHPGRVSFAQWLSNLARGLHLLGVALSEENGCSWIAGEKSAGQGIEHRLWIIGEPHPHLLYCMFHPGDEFRVGETGDAAAKVSFRKLRRGVVLAEEEAVHEGREESHAEVVLGDVGLQSARLILVVDHIAVRLHDVRIDAVDEP